MNINHKINLALKEFSIGNKESAYKKIKKIFNTNKNNNQLRFNLAVIEQSLNLNTDARINYEFLIEKEKNIKAIFNLYLLNIKEERFVEALDLINYLISTGFNENTIIKDKAFVLYRLKRYDESKKLCLDELKINKNDVNFLNILGLIYFGTRNFSESEKIFKKALSVDTNNISILNSLGRLYHEKRESKKAEEFLLKAYNIDNKSYEIINNLAGFYREEGKYEDAINYYKKALDLNPNNPSIINNIAKTYFDLDNLLIAEKYCLKALSLNKNDGNIQKILSLIYLRKQNYREAWKYFDGRLNLTDFREKNASITKLRSKLYLNKELEPKSKILILREQGVGDEILYGSMYYDLLKFCDNITIECDDRLKGIFQNTFPKYKDTFVTLGSISNDELKLRKYESVIYAGSLGKYFRNNIKDFENFKLLSVKKKYVIDAKNKLNNLSKKFNVGLSWKSFKNRYSKEKSILIDDLSNILNTQDCNFINLQYGDVKKEIETYNSNNVEKIYTFENIDLFNDLDKIAGVLKNLDIFISVSNSTAHLAGSLGVKTLLIKPTNHALFHYWNQPGNKTPWYKSVTLIEKEEILNEKNFVNKFLSI